MSKYELRVKKFATETGGATAIEYAAAAAFIATAAIGVAGTLNSTIQAESYATIFNGKVLLASSKQELVRIAARSSSDPIQTGSTSETDEPAENTAPSARKPVSNATAPKAKPMCHSGDDLRPCKLDLTQASFQGWRGTIVEWSQDRDE